MPWPLHEAIVHGLQILSWYENYVEKEIPPDTIWDDAEGIEEWFKAVKIKNDAKYTDGVPQVDNDNDDPEVGNQMIGNDLAGFFRE